MAEKSCSYCGTTRPLSAYSKNARSKDGLCSKCKVCQKQYNDSHKEQKRVSGIAYRKREAESVKARKRAYVLANPEWKRASNKAWVEANQEKVKRLARQRRLENPDSGKEARLTWRLENADRCKENARRWREANPGKAIEAVARRRAALIQATPPWANREKIREYYSAASFLTKLLGEKYEVDHIIPLRGKTARGLHVESNLQILSKIDNCIKNAKVQHCD